MALAGGHAVVPSDGKWLWKSGLTCQPDERRECCCLYTARDAGRGSGVGAKAKEGVGAMSKKHMGSGIDDFLKDEGIFEEAQAQAVKEVVARQLAEAMKKKRISKNGMATLLKTSRTQVDRLLNAKDDITLSSLQRAAAIVGRRVTIELV
jgi:antitoxin HicB